MDIWQVALIVAGAVYFGSIFVYGMWVILSGIWQLHRQKDS